MHLTLSNGITLVAVLALLAALHPHWQPDSRCFPVIFACLLLAVAILALGH